MLPAEPRCTEEVIGGPRCLLDIERRIIIRLGVYEAQTTVAAITKYNTEDILLEIAAVTMSRQPITRGIESYDNI